MVPSISPPKNVHGLQQQDHSSSSSASVADYLTNAIEVLQSPTTNSQKRCVTAPPSSASFSPRVQVPNSKLELVRTYSEMYVNDEGDLKGDDGDNSNVTSSSSDGRLKVVTFSPKVKAKRTLHLRDYTEEERINTWYDSYELEDIRRMNQRTVLRMKQHGGNNYEQQRGLEMKTRHGNEPVNLELQRMSKVVVLTEQYIQKSQGICHPDKLASAYRAITKSSETMALANAAFDEQMAQENTYYEEPQQECQHLQRRPNSQQVLTRTASQVSLGSTRRNRLSRNLQPRDILQRSSSLGEISVCDRRAHLLLARRKSSRKNFLSSSNGSFHSNRSRSSSISSLSNATFG